MGVLVVKRRCAKNTNCCVSGFGKTHQSAGWWEVGAVPKVRVSGLGDYLLPVPPKSTLSKFIAFTWAPCCFTKSPLSPYVRERCYLNSILGWKFSVKVHIIELKGEDYQANFPLWHISYQNQLFPRKGRLHFTLQDKDEMVALNERMWGYQSALKCPLLKRACTWPPPLVCPDSCKVCFVQCILD